MINLDFNVDFVCKKSSTDVTVEEFRLIVECMSENDITNYLEVGVWHGATLYSLVNLFKLNGHTIDAYGYDCFDEGAPSDVENSHTSGWPSKVMVQEIMDELGDVKLITGDARSISKIITDRKFDFVFHDANHTRDAIIGDLIVLKDILNPNAFVAVHNSSYDEPHRNFYGKSALDFLEAEGHYKIIKTAGTATLVQLV